MFNNLKDLRIEGKMLSTPTVFPLFNNDKQRILLMYGKNGSGKSTIARAIEGCSQEKPIEGISAQFIENNGNSITLTEEQKASLFIFNEEYVERTVKLKTIGLDTIVLFGEQGDLTEKINIAEKEYIEAKKDKETQDLVYEKYTDRNNIQSPEKQWNLLLDKLRGPESWAGKEAKIKGLKVNSKVNDSIACEIADIKISKPRKELQADFDKTMHTLSGFSPDSEKIQTNLKIIETGNFEELIISLLEKKIEEPILSERDKYLMSMVQKQGQEYYLNVKTYIDNPDHNQCPFCLQSLENDYKADLIERIQGILSDTAKKHIEQLEGLKLPETFFPQDQFILLEQVQVNRTEKAIKIVEGIANSYRMQIQSKKNHVYTPISFQMNDGKHSLGLEKAIDEANVEIEKLLNLVFNYNKTISDFQSIKVKAQKLNKEIAALDIANLYHIYNEQLKIKNAEDQKLRVNHFFCGIG